MEEPITLCRYKEQDEIEKNIQWLGEHTNEMVSKDVMKHDGEKTAIYTVLKGMYIIFCHKNGIFNKLEG